ncbi:MULTISPECIES: indolepyruvate ferredoxin oxidoreductase family protein [Paraburkholderia]|uniref:indolepyruvate ferredoxin oxidoreductase family protein n=1 Tax=Paraburkholderia TaxID=1822464 RepID=UPI000372E43D|nr:MULTISPECIES: indolepyruvate ferredoxin oxidoreductase family protein [Paraburkholderia]MDH6147561.1 indolepyruvate ferredoxin oxidoreductase [Paraburkholderia sp. WSM4179]
MNSSIPTRTQAAGDANRAVSIDDKYTLEKGRAYMSGTQALVRLPMLQKARDRRAGLNTAGFISGYRGSPLGAVDQALWNAKRHLEAHDIVFQPGVNEDLAATAVWGTQQVNLWPNARRDGVFGMWYGKGPGVDRTGDVFKHANHAGTDPRGGVLVLAGDDHAAKSSTIAHQSEHALIAAGIPVLYPSNVQEYLDFGLHGWAMSRYTGLWVAMKCVTDVVESSASVDVDPDRVRIVVPEDYVAPAAGLGIRWPDPPLEQEARLVEQKWQAALAYLRANRLNEVVIDPPKARYGIVASGKAYSDVRQALGDLGLDDAACARIGLRVLKVGCVWPFDPQTALSFAAGLERIFVIEEKRQLLEQALKEALYDLPVRPTIVGKYTERSDASGHSRKERLLPEHAELSPAVIAKTIADFLTDAEIDADGRARMLARVAAIEANERRAARPRIVVERKPWFCSGCPHNTSTHVPEGSRAIAGIGCHTMSTWMDRRTETLSQMGGEGATWIGQMHFAGDKHVFANLGDGTYFHSGLLAIRAAIAAKANITYKILYNDAVAMTGGQPVDGQLTVPQICHQVHAEGAARIVIVTDEPDKYRNAANRPAGVHVFHRDRLDDVQRMLRDTSGTTVLIYDQVCATEKRRRRKRGTYPDPAHRAFINDAVCEGCGDCSVQSNCLSVEPLETPLGTKRKINQSSCNKDFSCVKGFCPSFVVARGAQLRRPGARAGQNAASPDFDALPQPILPDLARPYGVLVTGVGGTGVVTIGGLIGMSAHLEGKGVSVLDMAGLAQKGGAVLSHVQLAASPEVLHATRIGVGDARLVVGCDAIVSAAADVLSRVGRGTTRAAINSGATPTAEFIHNPGWRFPGTQIESDLRDAMGDDCAFVDANALALALLGDTIYANPLLLGFVWQKGWLPLALSSLMRAIELNGVAVAKNQQAFNWGRYVAQHGAKAVEAMLRTNVEKPSPRAVVVRMPESLDRLIASRETMLTAYQNAAYACTYREAVESVRTVETDLRLDATLPLTRAVAMNLAKLMMYKDEYEVARLYAGPAYLDKLREQFEGEPGRDYRLRFYLAPPLLAKRDTHGELVKRPFGPWVLPVFRVLAKLKGLRGSVFDPFGKTEERRGERALIDEYRAMVDEFCVSLNAERFDAALQLAGLPGDIRGFGHVKARNMAAVATRREQWLKRYRDAAVSMSA